MSHTEKKALSPAAKTAVSVPGKPAAAKTGQSLKPTGRAALRPGTRLLSVVQGKEVRSLHLSPILHKIKDDGPAVIDGEVLPEAAAVAKLAKPAAAEAPAPAALVPPVVQALLGDRHTKILFGFCVALTIGLACSLWFSWQQQQHLETVEYLLETLIAGQR